MLVNRLMAWRQAAAMADIEPRSASLRYRPDIDGLRAIAVLPVCLFHIGLPGFPGGFTGVDVFFVISGYLMGRMIGQETAAGHFSLGGFYERRARRLLPALFTLLLCCYIAALALIPPKLFSDFGAALVGAVSFASNLVFWRASANYFEPATDWNPLVHTWSLGVEEQFYIVFPLFLLLIRQLRRPTQLTLVALVALVSLLASIWGTANAPTATFYLLPTRAWELLIGALPALWVVQRGMEWGGAECDGESARNSRVGCVTPGAPKWFASYGIRTLPGLLGLTLILLSLARCDFQVRRPSFRASEQRCC
jgi:peptidoglycan/LPS O-acetylase OafA/YrhL